MASDRYDLFYARKLWNLLPAIYRAEDSPAWDRKGPLQEIVDRIGADVAVVRRGIDRMWEDQSIESCDDRMIEFIGDLVATRVVESLDTPARRRDVANTIYYRRRKGTAPLIEQLAADITGWETRFVEFFHRLARTRHLLDPQIGDPALPGTIEADLQVVERVLGERTRTPAGGLADLRNVHGAKLAKYTAFDEYNHTADVRRGRGRTGWHNIPHVGLFVWRLKSVPTKGVDAVADKGKCKNQWTFDPTGRDVPLFALRDERPAAERVWTAARDFEVPGPISSDLLESAFEHLYPKSIQVHRFYNGAWSAVAAGDIAYTAKQLEDPAKPWKMWIDPERGRIILPTPAEAGFGGPFRVDYCAPMVAEIGAGAYERRSATRRQSAVAAETSVNGGGTALDAALTGTGVLKIEDSFTYTKAKSLDPVVNLTIKAANKTRPLLRLDQPWRLKGRDMDSTLVLDGLWICGKTIELAGKFKRVTIRCCSIDPGSWVKKWTMSADGVRLTPTRLRITGTIGTLEIERSIVGPVTVGRNGLVESLVIRDSIVQNPAGVRPALRSRAGEVMLERTTLLGPADIHRFDASECILHGIVKVADTQHGCVRFSAWTTGSVLPRRYESVEIRPESQLFTSVDFPQPGFGQLVESAGDEILEGAENGSEMGAFSRERGSLKRRSLLVKLQEYMPLGLEPVVVNVT